MVKPSKEHKSQYGIYQKVRNGEGIGGCSVFVSKCYAILFSAINCGRLFHGGR